MKLDLSLKQKTILSPQMQLSAKILQLNSHDLNTVLHQMAQENPVIELEFIQADDPKIKHIEKLKWLEENDDSYTYLSSYSGDGAAGDLPFHDGDFGESLEDLLLLQLSGLKLEEEEQRSLKYLIGCLDENGYLSVSKAQIMREMKLSEPKFLSALSKLQNMEPFGVGASDLKECLYIQAKHLEGSSPVLLLLIQDHLEDLAKNRVEQLAKQLSVSIKEIELARQQLLSLNPKPGNGYKSHRPTIYTGPDLFVFNYDGSFELLVNDYRLPRISISEHIEGMEHATPEDNAYVNEKIQQARQLLYSIDQRKQTLLNCAREIVRLQQQFFENGPGHMRPLNQSAIADKLALHPSTVSRALRDKHLQCRWGIIPLSDFFPSSLTSSKEGCRSLAAEEISQEAVMHKIRELIAGEDSAKPLSDQKISDLLDAMDIPVARRTVAKYREIMEILPARYRKRL